MGSVNVGGEVDVAFSSGMTASVSFSTDGVTGVSFLLPRIVKMALSIDLVEPKGLRWAENGRKVSFYNLHACNSTYLFRAFY